MTRSAPNASVKRLMTARPALKRLLDQSPGLAPRWHLGRDTGGALPERLASFVELSSMSARGYTQPSQPVTGHVRYRADSGRQVVDVRFPAV